MTYLRGETSPNGTPLVPTELQDLLERPLVAFLATRRPDGALQCNPMWFQYDGERILLSHASDRQKWRNMAANPYVSLAIADPDNPFRYVEVRGRVVSSDPDEDASFHRSLRTRYGMASDPVPDADRRVVVVVAPTFIGGRQMADQTSGDRPQSSEVAAAIPAQTDDSRTRGEK